MGNGPEQLSVARSSRLIGALAEDLAHGGGIQFIYRSLARLKDEWGLEAVLAVLDDPGLGRQVFNHDRRPLDPGWQRHVALHSPPGVYTAPAVVDAADDLVAIHHFCTVAFRLDLLHYQSMHDALTGLYNRRGFDEQLAQAVGRSRRYGWAFSLVLIDLNRFKAINDRLGHPGGDAVLRAVGDRLRQSLRAGDIAGRIGGDEFALLLPTDRGDAVPSLVDRLHVEVDVGDLEPPEIELSVGVATCPDEAQSIDALYELADQRLYETKRQ